MLEFLTLLTGIDRLITDPYFSGGGLHQIVNGGSLDIHADFNFDEKTSLWRRINLLLYLNEDWPQSYGGELELWPRDMSACAARIAPHFNRCVIFNTDSDSFHGHPNKLNVPDGVTRNSIAIYYYTVASPPGAQRHATLWRKL